MTHANFRDAAPAGTQVRGIVLSRAFAQGGEGIVYEAVHPEFGAVLVKEFWPKQIVSRARSLRAQPALSNWQDDYRRGIERFIALAERLRDLPPHPGILRVREIIPQNNTAYLVMDRVPGRTLEEALDAGGFTDSEQVERLAAKLTSAMEHLHGNGLFHRDIAPDNIIITPGHDWEAVLIDFNAAKDIVMRASRSQEGIVKPGYTPIEQYDTSGNEPLGPWTDIYAAAAVLYRCVVGQAPADPAMRLLRPGQEVPLSERFTGKYPDPLLTAIDLGLKPQPDERPQSVEQWRELLEAEQRARAAAEAKAKAEAEARLQAEADALLRAEAARRTELEDEVRARIEAEVRAEAEARERAAAKEREKEAARERKRAEKEPPPVAEAFDEPEGPSPPDRKPFIVGAAVLFGLVLAYLLWGAVSGGPDNPSAAASDSAKTAASAPADPAASGSATPSPKAKATPSPKASDPRPRPVRSAQCRQVCTGGEQTSTPRRSVGSVRSLGTTSFREGEGGLQGKAQAKANSVCGGQAQNVSYRIDGACSGNLCFIAVTGACVTTTYDYATTPRQCRQECD